jgi:hypothetical protein
MADNNQAEQNRLLKEENKILKEQLDLKSESISLSGALLDDIKELFGIQSKRNTQEQGILSLNKEINRQINNQKISASSVNEVQKQIAKNSNLIEKSIAQQDSLNKKLLGADKLRVETIEDSLKNLDKNEKKLQEILNLSKEERDLQQDMIKGLKEDIKLDNDIIDNNLENLSLNGKILLNTKLQTKELEKQNKEREKDKESLKKIEDSLGVAGKLSKLISSIPGLGSSSAKALEAVTEKLKEAADEGKPLPNRMQTFGMLVKETGKNLITDLKDPFVVIGFLMKEFIAAFKLLDGLTGDLAKNMNMSYQDASAMSSELNSAANASGDIFVTTKGMHESLSAINKTLGTNVMLNKEDLATMTKFRTAAGLTNEELTGIYKLTLGTNKSLKDATGEVLAQAKISFSRLGVALNEKEVLKEIKDVSAATTLSLGKNPSLIAEAVAVAKSLGMEMSKIDAIAESLLNFQSSIESELEAELLTGRQLNLEQARYYALTNDVAGLAEEINKNLGSSAEFGKMNRLQQDAIAKSVGMNREELAKTLFIQDQLKGVSGEEAEKRRELLNSLEEQYGIEKAQQMLKEKSIEDLENQASIQDRFNASVEKLREVFVSLIDPLIPVLNVLADMSGIISTIVGTMAIYKGIQLAILGIQKTQATFEAIKTFNAGRQLALSGAYNISASARQVILQRELAKSVGIAAAWAIANPFQAIAGLAIAAGVGAVVYSQMKDGKIDPKKGPVLSGEFGSVQLDPMDKAMYGADGTIKVGTDLMGNNKSSPSVLPSINMQPLVERLDQMNQILNSILNKEGNVSIDGNLVGKTLALAEYRTGS